MLFLSPIPGVAALRAEISLSLVPVLAPLLARLRALFDLDADTTCIERHLSSSPRIGQIVQRTPGLRVPGAFDGFEVALRAILGQQVSVKGATTLSSRFAERFGEPIVTPFEALTRLPPSAESLAGATIEAIMALGVTTARAQSICALACAVASGSLRIEPGPAPEETIACLEKLPGIGPWTSHYIGMRALRWPDAFPHSDLGLKKALNEPDPAKVLAAAEEWRPWRAYAALHLWQSLHNAPEGNHA